MARMSLHDDRISGRERRRGIAATCAEREWKITRAKHRHRSARDEHPAQIGFWQRLAVKVRRIDHRFDPRSLANDLGEHTKLDARTGTLARKARPRQGRFKLATFQ